MPGPDPKPRPRATGGKAAGDPRTRLYRAVLAACKRRGLDADARRDMQEGITGKASMADMTLHELGQVLDHLNTGWGGPRAHRPHLGKIKALWWSLYYLGEVSSTNERAISAFVERQTGISALPFLDWTRSAAVIEALKAWLARAGVEWPTPEQTAAIAACAPGFNATLHERHAVLAAIARRLFQPGESWIEALSFELGLSPMAHAWSTHELDTAIKHLGEQLRREAR